MQDLGLSKVELGDIAGVIWLDTETSLGTLKNLKQWLLKGRNALAGLEDDEKQDLRRLAGNLEVGVLFFLLDLKRRSRQASNLLMQAHFCPHLWPIREALAQSA